MFSPGDFAEKKGQSWNLWSASHVLLQSFKGDILVSDYSTRRLRNPSSVFRKILAFMA